MSGTLTGIGWDHPRCSGPLGEAARQWRADGNGTVEWTYRSLADFNSAGLAELARSYDLLVVDHPMIPHDAAVLRRLDGLPAVQRARTDTIGASGTAYDWDGATYGVPVDVACHVSAARLDLLDELGEQRPDSWASVLELAERRPGLVVAALSGDDAVCTLLTLTASMGRPITAGCPPDLDAIDILLTLARLCPPECATLRPPAVLAELAAGRAGYAPALFGYATYLLAPSPTLVYGSVPRCTDSLPASGVLGGAGLAVSAYTQVPALAEEFVEWIMAPAVQRDALVAGGGQPGAFAVWNDPAADAALGGFLAQTREATDQAVVRLRHPAWPDFQRRCAGVLEAALPQLWSTADVDAALRTVHAETIGQV